MSLRTQRLLIVAGLALASLWLFEIMLRISRAASVAISPSTPDIPVGLAAAVIALWPASLTAIVLAVAIAVGVHALGPGPIAASPRAQRLLLTAVVVLASFWVLGILLRLFGVSMIAIGPGAPNTLVRMAMVAFVLWPSSLMAIVLLMVIATGLHALMKPPGQVVAALQTQRWLLIAGIALALLWILGFLLRVVGAGLAAAGPDAPYIFRRTMTIALADWSSSLTAIVLAVVIVICLDALLRLGAPLGPAHRQLGP